MEPLSEVAAKSIINSLNHETKSILLQKLIEEASETDKTEIFESIGFKLYGGVRLRDGYHYVIFGLCSGASEVKKNKVIDQIYDRIDQDECFYKDSLRILIVSYEEDDQRKIRFSGLKTKRSVSDKESEKVYEALIRVKPDYKDENFIVFRIIKEENNSSIASLFMVNELHKILLSTNYCANTDTNPIFYDTEFCITINDIKRYVLCRNTECIGGY